MTIPTPSGLVPSGVDIDEPVYGEWIECWQCAGDGALAGCFEDTCCGADCDPEDPDFCCAPTRCDICKGKGGWHHEESAS